MTNPHPELLEMIIRECAAAHPRPWYPAQLVPGTGVPQEKLEASLDQLRLGGLVRLTPWVQGHGQGYELTPYGTQVVEHPRLLQRLSSGEVPQAPAEAVAPSMERHALQNLRGEKIRNALVTDAQPIVTKMLLAANIIWFLVGLAVHTREGGTVGRYLTATDPDLGRTYDELGALALPYLADLSQWWRLVGYGFLHGGILHLLMNMYALFSIGPLMERMWGRAGFMALYLISCVGGGAAAVLLTPDHAVVGASGAICGLLGSMATWLFLNRAYLPPHIVANWQRSIISNVLLIALISMLPRVSWAGHLGGGVAGLIIAAPLNLAHFGEGEKKWLGWAAAILMTVVGLAGLHVKIAAMKQEFAHDPALDPTNKIMLKAKETANEALELAVEFLYGKAPKPEGNDAKKLQAKYAKAQKELRAREVALSKVGDVVVPEQRGAITVSRLFLDQSSNFSGAMAQALTSNEPWTAEDLARLRRMHIWAAELNKDFERAWQALEAAWPRN